MAIGDISLSASARANLLSLQGTAKLLGTTQEHLSSGKKVASALDNASSFFASQGFINSANDLSSLKDNMATALQTIKAASDAITSIKNVVSQLQGVVNSALQTTDSATRAGLANQYNGLLSQLDSLANDASFNGTNLVNSVTSQLKILFNASGTTNLTVSGANLTSTGMGMGNAVGNFAVGVLATDTTNNLTVNTLGSSTATNGVGYSGAITFTATGSTAPAAPAAVTAANVLTVHSLGYTNGANVTAAVTGAPTLTGLTAVGSSVADTSAGTIITGTFTATANAAANASYTDATGKVTATAVGQFSVVVAAGDTITVHNGTGAAGTTQQYVNNSGANVTITLATANNDAINSGSNTTTTYKVANGAGQVGVAAGLNLSNVNNSTTQLTVGGVAGGIVNSGTLGVGSAVTAYTTGAAAAGAAIGTVNNGTVVDYDTGSSVASSVVVGSLTATKTGVGATSAANTAYVTDNTGTATTISLTNIKALSGTSTSVTAEAITTAQNQLSAALATLRTAGSGLGNNNTLVQTRQDYTTNLVATLQTASDNLVLADTNEEGANMQALQARNQLGIVSLGISGQLAQSILKLF